MLYNDLMNKTTMKTYTLTITEKQARALMDACELLSRIQGGQIREVFEHLPLKKGVDWEAYHEIQDELTKRMPEILEDGIDGWSSSFGVGHPELPESHDIAWDLYQVIRYEISTQQAIDDGIIQKKGERDFSKMMTVNYDPPMRFGSEKLAKMERVE
jgi:hypothetical protein